MNNRWLVVWQENFSHDDPLAATAGAFVNPDGTYTTSFTIYGIYTTSMYSYGPSLASNGSTALVVQNAEISSGVEMDLAGQIIYDNGSLGSTINLTPWEGNQYRPRVAWDGSYFIVAYQDQRNRLADWELDQLDARSDLFGMRVGVDGSILDPRGFLFSNSTGAEAYPNVAAANGVSLMAASIMRPAPYIAYRVGYEQLGIGGNAWPVAEASAAPSGGTIPLPVTFSSAGSTDPDGSISEYSWDFGDGVSSSLANPTHTYTSGGPFVATLTVTDNQGAQSTTTVLVKALKPNMLPIAIASADKISGPAPLDVTFYATGSYDPDGSLGNFRWDFSDGSQYWGPTVYNTFNSDGVYTAELTVFDNYGGSGSKTITITVTSSNVAPILAPIGNKSVDELKTLVFTATATDSDLPPQSLTFSLGGDAPMGASITPEGAFSWTPTEQQGPGVYPITVIVTDDGQPALSDSETIYVTVREVGLNPIVDAGPDQTADEGQPVQFSGSFTNPGLLLAGELINWEFGDGSILTGTLTPTHSYGDNGNFKVTLTIDDGAGGIGSDSLVVTVNNIAPILTPVSDQSVMAGTPLTIAAAITDPGWLDNHTVVIEWGDGTTDTFNLPAGILTLDLVHTFTAPGTFMTTLNVKDDDGGLDELAFGVSVTPAGYWTMLPLVHK
jgi:PKD repeat protein